MRAVYVTCLVWFLLAVPVAGTAGDRYDLDGGLDTALLTGGVAGALLAWHLSSSLDPLDDEAVAALDPDGIRRVDRIALGRWSPGSASASDMLFVGLTLGPLGLLADTSSGVSGAEFAAMYIETMLLEKATMAALKASVRRTRPYAYGDDPRVDAERLRSRHARRSFPSGHTSGAFAGAVFASEVFARLHPRDEARHWVRAGALTLAVSTGVLRVRAGHHFPSDVLVGALVGSFVGWVVPRLHEVDPASGSGGSSSHPTPGLVFAFGF